MTKHLRTRRPFRWLVAATLLVGGGALAVPRLRVDRETAEAPAQGAAPVARLGPLPVALQEETPSAARLSGQIETALGEMDSASDTSAEQTASEMRIPRCEPPPLGDDPWRPSTRVASYQTEIKRSPPAASAPPVHKTASAGPLTHRIADGDTLSGLAQRYLGSSSRFGEIFAANRDRLESPDLLPIGMELRIPAVPATHAAE